MSLLRPEETMSILNSNHSTDWFVNHFLKHNDDSDCQFIRQQLPPATQDAITAKIDEYIRLVEQECQEVQKQREEVQKQTRIAEEVNELVLRQIENTQEMKRQLGISLNSRTSKLRKNSRFN